MQIGPPSATHQPSADEIIERAIAKTLGSNKHVDRALLRQHMQENRAAMDRKRRGEVDIINSLKDDVALDWAVLEQALPINIVQG